ncbi:uncharacterized protein LOC126843149 [Adelges cooleyi]|uniref:uncharacterized protein LOC126843149 n=1 Tax=Adelges cooleyi TaxID=133065 RepID=UPI00218016C2|nr:uncharacterized protein LOC126843149 [Adelges cooleyi]
MNAKYIIFICFAMNYLAILSVANDDKKKELSRFYPLTLNVYNELRKFFELDTEDNLFEHALVVLWSDTDYNVETYLSLADIATMKEKGISVDHFGKINWEICKRNDQDYETCMNQRLLSMKTKIQNVIDADERDRCQTTQNQNMMNADERIRCQMLSTFSLLTLNVYNELRKFFELVTEENLSVHALHVLWSNTDYNVETYLSPADIATIKEKGISVEHFGKTNWEFCKSNDQDYEPCMNQRLSFMQNLNQKMIEANKHVICQTVIQSVFDELLELLVGPNLQKVLVNQLTKLWPDNGATMKANFTSDELIRMNREGIDIKRFEEITRKIYKTDYVKSMTERFLFIKAQNKPIKQALRL